MSAILKSVATKLGGFAVKIEQYSFINEHCYNLIIDIAIFIAKV